MKWLSLGVCNLMLFQMAAQVTPQPPRSLNIVVQEGEGAINNIHQRTAREAVVQVEDENHRPVAGAAVVFTLPTSGPSGEFSNGAKTITVMTDEAGKAAVRSLKINNLSGKLQIHVNASYRGQTARTTITQFNMDVPGASAGGSGKLIAILAVVGAVAAGGALAATRIGSNGSSSPAGPAAVPITITPGTGTVGAPR